MTPMTPTSDRPGPDLNHPQRVTPARLRLLHDYLAVRPLAVSTRNAGGSLFIPDNAGARERSQRGVVVSVGPGEFTDAGVRLPMSIKAGDLVFFGKYAGTEEDFGGRSLLIMRETECRVSVPAGEFVTIEHENPKLDHLVEDYCEACHGDPDAEARVRLEEERAKLVAQTSPETAQSDAPAAGGASPLASGELLEFGRSGNDRERRACPGDAGVPCLYTQMREGPEWVGARCGHRHPVNVIQG